MASDLAESQYVVVMLNNKVLSQDKITSYEGSTSRHTPLSEQALIINLSHWLPKHKSVQHNLW